MRETRSAAAIRRVEASGASRAAWGAFWAADAKSSRLEAAAKDAGELSAALEAERVTVAAEAADAKSSRLLTAAKEAGDLSARLLSAALDAERVAVAAEAAFADAVKRFPQEGD